MAGYHPPGLGEPGTINRLSESKEGKQKAVMIEFFKEPNIDWMGKAKYFYALSAILLLAGWFSIWHKGGMYYGIDFKGGTNVDVQFSQPPNVDKIRQALSAQGLGNSEIQSISDIGAQSNEVLIFVGQNGTNDEAADVSKDQVIKALNSAGVGTFTIRGAEIVGAKVGGELRSQAIWVTLLALAGMLVYIAFRFEWVFGAAAVLAVFHDVLITLGFFSLLHFEISLTVIAALLTLVGYSMNDTIVIFDRIRENRRLLRKEEFAALVNKSINQTLSRTILTSGLTFLTVLVLFLMGGQVLRAFSFALVVGIVVGTYSSFGIAAPLIVFWHRWRDKNETAGTGTAAGNKARVSESAAGRLAPAGRR
ncbi:MAG TPA: protein translocase subunit SecF [Candidatus Dormibacteraeota bacterium]|jgi:preprotein translocase subunit SecF|nr:protein translocase subunit SecF [Candidatus Dormibacteraeota bacterium]